MTIAAGTKLGSYEITGAIGAGGMGEVYRARDSKLGRDVALKILPEKFARDSDRMARFQREAKVLASLNHPNIATIHGLEDSSSTRALVMELVEGPTLADRIRQGPIPVDEAVRIARQIADALEYAHERGIVHRDLKPANVKVTADDIVKVLDFGLAKALEGDIASIDISTSPTISRMATQAGILLGTAAYMSPEQAKGKAVDRRADIWAFGCVLYEMLTGKLAFSGETVSDTLAAVIRADPDWSLLPAATPMRVRILLQRCLQKDPKQRLRDIGDARISLDEALAGTPDPSLIGVVPALRSGMALALLVGGIVLGAIGSGLVVWHVRPAPAPGVVSRFAFSFPAPEIQQSGLNSFATGSQPKDYLTVAISPDGTKLAYVAAQDKTTQIFLRSLDSLESQPVSGTAGATSPFFSPDGQWVGFFADGKLKKVSVHGGDAVALCDAPINRGASWGADNTIVFSPSLFTGLMRVSATGGTPETLAALDIAKGERSYRWPEILPGGKAVVFVVGRPKDVGYFSQAVIAVERLDTHERRVLSVEGTYPRHSPSGHLLFAREGRIFAIPFDLNRLDVTGPPVPVLDGVKNSPNSGVADYAVSQTGSLVYLTGNTTPSEGRLVWLDRTNHIQELPAPARSYGSPQISPDGQRVAVSISSTNTSDIWLYEIGHGTLTRLTFDEQSTAPLWSPDGKQVAFVTSHGGGSILSKSADGSGADKTLISGQDLIMVPTSWSPDARFLAYWTTGSDTGGRDISILPLEDEGKPQPFLRTKFEELGAKFSPDGRWLAYESDESGRLEVYVQPFPGPGGKWQVSTDGGTMPVWAHNGRELFYLNSDKVMSVGVVAHPDFSASVPRTIADAPQNMTSSIVNADYDVSPDGQRFLFVRANVENRASDEARVVLNWTEELKQLTSTSNQP